MRRLQLSWPVVIIGALALMMLGAGGAYWWMARPRDTTPISSGAVAAAPERQLSGSLPDVAVTLSDDAAAKAGIVVSAVTVSQASRAIRLSGVVAPNAYREVVVTPLTSGRVMRVAVTLGERVARGATLVEIYSPELAETQTRYLSMKAEFQAVEQEIARTTRLAEIGAASQQELERIHAEHVRHRTEVESARTRLQLLGMTSQQIETLTATGLVTATSTVQSPIGGVVTDRAVNPGTSVDAATPLVTVVDLSTVWIVGDLYEPDFSRVSVGTPATVRTTAFPDQEIVGRIAYIDPQVRPETRTARVRVEVSNPAQQLRLGMYAEVQVEVPGQQSESVTVPSAAVQKVGDRTVVYVADPTHRGRFIEREVRVGDTSGGRVVVLSGLEPGDQIATEGTFSLRAEGERLGLRPRD